MTEEVRGRLYNSEIDFGELALRFPDFAKRLKPNGQLDFSDPESVRQLTKCLLRRDFGLEIDLPEDRLCPPVPNRYNYILWIQDLLDSSSPSYKEQPERDREVKGLDIGTGASCIYPLLGCRARPNWIFVATGKIEIDREVDPAECFSTPIDVDTKSLQYARKNLELNALESRVKLLEADPAGQLIPHSIPGHISSDIDFTMMNPPFYESSKDLLQSAASKSRPPNSACTGAEIEMIYSAPQSSTNDQKDRIGGELGFTLRLLHESTLPECRDRIQWFTSMLGKLSTAVALVDKIREMGCKNYALTEFVQGNKTRRWGVGWSWQPLRPADNVVRGTDALGKSLLPPKTEMVLSTKRTDDTVSTFDGLAKTVDQLMESFEEIDWVWKRELSTGVGRAPGNVWGRRARRQKGRGEKVDNANDADVFVFKISLRPSREISGTAYSTEVHLRWLKGDDSVLFESFCGMVRRRIHDSLGGMG